MITLLFIVIANEALKCVGFRYCEPMSSVELVRMWQIGLLELMYEGIVGGTLLRIYRRASDKFPGKEDREDRLIDPKDLGH